MVDGVHNTSHGGSFRDSLVASCAEVVDMYVCIWPNFLAGEESGSSSSFRAGGVFKSAQSSGWFLRDVLYLSSMMR